MTNNGAQEPELDGEYSVPDAPARVASPSEFLQALATALLAWQAVESSTFRLFHALLRTSDEAISGAVFFTVDSFGVRFKMIDNLIGASIREATIIDAWNDLKPEIRSAQAHRNKIAHWDLRAVFENAAVDLVLAQPFHRPDVMQKRGQDRLDRQRLIELHDEFGRVSLRIDSIRHRLTPLAR